MQNRTSNIKVIDSIKCFAGVKSAYDVDRTQSNISTCHHKSYILKRLLTKNLVANTILYIIYLRKRYPH